MGKGNGNTRNSVAKGNSSMGGGNSPSLSMNNVQQLKQQQKDVEMEYAQVVTLQRRYEEYLDDEEKLPMANNAYKMYADAEKNIVRKIKNLSNEYGLNVITTSNTWDLYKDFISKTDRLLDR